MRSLLRCICCQTLGCERAPFCFPRCPPQIAKKSTTMLLPSTAHDPASMVAQALSIYSTVSAAGKQQPEEETAAVEEKRKPW